MHAREYVDIVITSQLIRPKPNDKIVPNDEFHALIAHLEPTIYKVANDRFIPGFTSEDLESFMHMKVHQVLRRGKYDPARPARPFFQVTFNFLLNDINRMRNKAIADCMRQDALDDALEYVAGMDDYRQNVTLGEDQ